MRGGGATGDYPTKDGIDVEPAADADLGHARPPTAASTPAWRTAATPPAADTTSSRIGGAAAVGANSHLPLLLPLSHVGRRRLPLRHDGHLIRRGSSVVLYGGVERAPLATVRTPPPVAISRREMTRIEGAEREVAVGDEHVMDAPCACAAAAAAATATSSEARGGHRTWPRAARRLGASAGCCRQHLT